MGTGKGRSSAHDVLRKLKRSVLFILTDGEGALVSRGETSKIGGRGCLLALKPGMGDTRGLFWRGSSWTRMGFRVSYKEQKPLIWADFRSCLHHSWTYMYSVWDHPGTEDSLVRYIPLSLSLLGMPGR